MWPDKPQPVRLTDPENSTNYEAQPPSVSGEAVTPENAENFGAEGFGRYQKTGTTRISNFTVPAGTRFKTPEGLHAEDEECRIAFDPQGGVYPIRESVFQEVYRRV